MKNLNNDEKIEKSKKNKKKKKKKRKRSEEDIVSVPVQPAKVLMQPVAVPVQAATATQTKKKSKKNNGVPKNILWDFKSKSTINVKPKKGRQWDVNRPSSLKQGTFSADEKKIVMDAIKSYAKEHGITDLSDLISQDRTKRGAWSTIALALPHRSVRSIYNHGQRVLAKGLKTGRWTPEEVTRMHELYAKHGRKWKLIGGIMNRDPNHIRNKHTKLMEESCNVNWDDAEDKMLTELVQIHHKDLAIHRGERVWPMFNIQWHEIRKKMTTRKRTYHSFNCAHVSYHSSYHKTTSS